MNRLVLSVTGFFFLFLAVATVHGATVGSVTALEGRADITPSGGRAVPLQLGDSVDQGDIVRTKSRSKIEITFQDGSIVRLAASSRVRVDEYTMGKGNDRGILKLFRGKIQSIVKKSRGLFGFGKRNRFEVHTPTAICGVRGTNYFSSYQGGASNFVFKEGSGYGYSLNRPDEVMLIETGQAMTLAGAGRKPVVRPASEAELKQHSEDTDAGESQDQGKDDDSTETGPQDSDDADSGGDDTDAEEGGDGSASEPDSGDGGEDAGDGQTGDGDGAVASGESAGDSEGSGAELQAGADSSANGEAGGTESEPGTGGDEGFVVGSADSGTAGEAEFDGQSAGGALADNAGSDAQGSGDALGLDAGLTGDTGGSDGMYLASGYGNDAEAADLYSASGDLGAVGDASGYDATDISLDGVASMDLVMDAELLADTDVFTADLDVGYDGLDDTLYSGIDDLNYDLPVWDTDAQVPELEVMHEIAWDANGNPAIQLYGTFDPTIIAPSAMGIEIIEGDLDNYRFFLGTIGGVWYGGSVEGDLLALYVGTGGDAGILRADWSGTYGADNTWKAGWTPLTTFEMAATGIPFVEPDPVPEPSPIYYDSQPDLVFPSGGGSITVNANQDELMGAYLGFTGQDWGVWRSGLWGDFTGTLDSNWIVAIECNAAYSRNMHLWMEYIGDHWADGQIKATAAGAWVDLTEATTGVLGGVLHGVYDPSDPEKIWDAVAGGVSLETSRFLAMVNGTTADRTLVENLGLPSFEVGSVSLSGSDALMNVSMNNVTFFSFDSGGAPRVWASDDVTGSFSAVPAAYHTVALSGGGLNADFMVREWSGGSWAAEVTSAGTGTLTRSDTTGTVDLSFAGGAAGTYTNGGAFSGTAAGVAKPVVSAVAY